MLRPVTIEHDRAAAGSRAGRARAARRPRPRPGSRPRRTPGRRARELPLRRRARTAGRAGSARRRRAGSPRGRRARRRRSPQRRESTGAPARQLSHIAGAPAAADGDAQRSRRAAASARKTPIASAPFPTGTTTAAGGSGELVEQLVADRLVAVELRRLGAVLEEEQAVARGVARAPPPSPRPCRRRRVELGALLLDQRDLCRARARAGRRRSRGCPPRFAAHAVAAPWLPVDAVTTTSGPARVEHRAARRAT